MSLFNWFSKPPRIRLFEDSFARTTHAKLLGLKNAIASREDSNQLIILVGHFADTFVSVQELLDSSSIEYEVAVSKINLRWLEQNSTPKDNKVYLTLAKILAPEMIGPRTTEIACGVGVLVAERHPLPSEDERIEQFCRALPCRVELGYFLSFEDTIIRTLIDDSTMKILDMFGMGENELVTSKMVSQRLKRMLRQQHSTFQTNHGADSAEQWIKRNSVSQS